MSNLVKVVGVTLLIIGAICTLLLKIEFFFWAISNRPILCLGVFLGFVGWIMVEESKQ